jgi:uncharacterized protein with GYD domain
MIMSRYFVTHVHTPETCPAKNPEMGQMLLTHLSRMNARKYGIDLQGEAVLDGKHTLNLIIEARDKDSIEKFMQPFAMAGSVEITQASSCEEVVAREGC